MGKLKLNLETKPFLFRHNNLNLRERDRYQHSMKLSVVIQLVLLISLGILEAQDFLDELANSDGSMASKL